MAVNDHNYDRMDRPHLYGRGPLLDQLLSEMSDGYTLFGIEGIGGVGKSQVTRRFLEAAAERFDAHLIILDASALPSESLVIASMFTQFRSIPRHVDQEIERVGGAIAAQTVGVAKRLLGAAVQDLAKYAFEKFEHVAEVVKEEITGERRDEGISQELETLDTWNKRTFIRQFMQVVADLGNRVLIEVDNYEATDPSAQEFFRFLIGNKPDGWVVALINDTEIRPQADWAESMSAQIEYKAGKVHAVGAISGADAAEWYRDEIGRDATPDELANLINASDGGRPVQLGLLLAALRTGTAPGPMPSYARLQQVRRSELTAEARTVAELLAFAPANAVVPRYFLEKAAQSAGVGSFGSAMDQLQNARQMVELGGDIRFNHSSEHGGWRATIGESRYRELGEIWYSAYTALRLGIGVVANTGMLPALTHEVVAHEDGLVLSSLAQELIGKGAQDDALYLLDASWEAGGGMAASDVIEHALIAAQARLDLGRYKDAQVSLRSVELRGGESAAQKVLADLIRLKLALRQNAYGTVWTLSDKLLQAAPDDRDIQIERELVINTAFRDLLDTQAIHGSVERLILTATEVSPAVRAKIDRSLARSFAKLGRIDEALARAEEALALATEVGDVRAIGNAELAVAEALRYSGRPDEAHEPYQRGADLGRGSGNRDSWIWCLLGDACAYLQEGRLKDALSIVGDARAVIEEPGYEHPLEAAHISLIAATVKMLGGADVDLNPVLRPYRSLGINWPATYLQSVEDRGILPGPVPI